ncbi:MAG: MBL fold metallo-hydrolase [Nitrospiraceae bacterium]
MSLEDDFSDIIKKARHGQGLSLAEVAKASGLPVADITALERGNQPRHREEVHALAQALGLRDEPLKQIAFENWTPEQTLPPACVETIHGAIGGYAVKGYVVHDAGEAVLIDTGYNPAAILKFLTQKNLRLNAICLTHGHADHAEGIAQILATWPVPVYVGPDDLDLLNWRPSTDRLEVPDDGRTIQVGQLQIDCVITPGHTPGGICYRVKQEGPLCFVGDTLFAGSIGRANPVTLYPRHLDSVRRRVLTLPQDTVLFPGHGPATIVREEVTHNPFA